MNQINQIHWMLVLLVSFSLGNWARTQEVASVKPDAAKQEPIEVLTRGPIHEAFAAPVNQQPTAPTPIAKQPPPPVKEDPPAERPDLDNAQWIPGYWAWDAERQDFLWVTGVYRAAPQGRTYVPGYWENSAQGYRWIAGFWSNDKLQDLTYAPEPPAPLSTGPKGQAPNDDSIYVPGAWVYSNDRFVWREGYWTAALAGRVWIPSQYLWTPNGYVFVDGYWDAPFASRGLAYAPLYFNQPLYQNPNWSYQPSYIVNPNAFYNSAFTYGPSFYFGNYYNPLYARLGFSPWFAGNGRYDPLFSYHGWQNNRGNPNWIASTQQLYTNRSAGIGVLPPTTLAQQNTFGPPNRGGFAQISTPAQFHSNNFRLVQTTPTQLNAQRAQGQYVHQAAANRQRLEMGAAHQVSLSNFQNGGNRTLNMHTVMGGTPMPHTSGQPIWQNNHATTAPSLRMVSPTNSGAGLNLNTHSIQSHQMFSQPQMHHAAPIYHSAPIHHAAPAMHGGGHAGGGHRR